MTVAALYIDPRGPYPSIPDVDCWDESRDARKYDGPHPAVAHPPCRHWGRLRHLAGVTCTACDWSDRACDLESMGGDEPACPECGGEPDWNDRDCAPRAVEQVRKFGGVLEHPAGSKLWEAVPDMAPPFGPRAELGIDPFGGYTIELDQVEWGHVARKRTWLYLVGVPRSALEDPPFPGREPTHYASGGRTKSSRQGAPVPEGIKVCSAAQRRRTPPLFAEYLIRLARAAGEARRAA